MLTSDLLAFVRASLPAPPARVLEIGAGRGELAAALAAAGHEVTAVDPAAEPGSVVRPMPLLDVEGSFDAAVAVVSLHHVEPLEASCDHLAGLLAPGSRLVIDEIDVSRHDERAIDWWLAQRRALRLPTPDDDAAGVLAKLRAHIHPLQRICDALRPHFSLGTPIPGPYLHRWELRESLRDVEVELIAAGGLPPIGARLIATRHR